MDERTSFRPFLLSTIILFIGGWAGVVLVTNFTLPTLWPRWGFFALTVIALTGTAMPVVWFFNARFPSTPPVLPQVIVRESIWVGVYGAVLAWLAMGRVLTFGLGVGLAGGLILAEYLVRWRERINSVKSPVSYPRKHEPPQ